MNIGTRLNHLLFCKEIGKDYLKNNYYISKFKNAEGKFIRSVWYNNVCEASKVPPLWHAWLHYVTDEIPINDKNYSWQIPHIPNLTGTSHAYLPTGHLAKGGERDKVSSDYESWQP